MALSCWKVFADPPTPAGGGPSPGFTTDHRLSRPVKNIYWRYFWNVQNVLVQPEEKMSDEGEEMSGGVGGKGLKHFELHSAIGTKAAECRHLCESNNDASPRRASQSNRRFMSCVDVKSSGRKDETRGFFFCLSFDCHSLFLMFVCNIQRKMLADQMKASIPSVGGGQTASSVHQTGERRFPS